MNVAVQNLEFFKFWIVLLVFFVENEVKECHEQMLNK